MKTKYRIENCYEPADGVLLIKTEEDGKSMTIARFYEPNARTNAQKVCDLLSETSRSKGVYPK